MPESTIHALYGMLAEKHEILLAEYKRLLSIANGLATGEIEGSRFKATGDDSWKLNAVEVDESSEANA